MKNFRFWLASLILGDYSYIKNCIIYGRVQIRGNHFVTCCSFIEPEAVVFVNDKIKYPENVEIK